MRIGRYVGVYLENGREISKILGNSILHLASSVIRKRIAAIRHLRLAIS